MRYRNPTSTLRNMSLGRHRTAEQRHLLTVTRPGNNGPLAANVLGRQRYWPANESDLPLAVTGSFFSCCPTKLGFSVVSSQGKYFLLGNTPTEEVVFTYITATVCRFSSINLNPAFSFSAVDSSCQLVFVPKRCVSR